MNHAPGATRRVGRPVCKTRTYFHEINELDKKLNRVVKKWQCNQCNMKYGEKTGTANFKRHLKSVHGIVLDESGNPVALPNSSNPNLENVGYNGVALSPLPSTPQVSTIGQEYTSHSYPYTPASVGQHLPASPSYVHQHSPPLAEQKMTSYFNQQTQSFPDPRASTPQSFYSHPSVGQQTISSTQPFNLPVGQSFQQNNPPISGQTIHHTISSETFNYNDPQSNGSYSEQISPQNSLQQNLILPPSSEDVQIPQYSDPLSMMVQNACSDLQIPEEVLDGDYCLANLFEKNYESKANEIISFDQIMHTSIGTGTLTDQTGANDYGQPMDESVTIDPTSMKSQTETAYNYSNLNAEYTNTQWSSQPTGLEKLASSDSKNHTDVKIDEIQDNVHSKINDENSSQPQLTASSQYINYFLTNPQHKNDQQIVQSQKRHQIEIDIDIIQGFEYVYEQLSKSGFSKIEIQYKMIEMAVNSPMHLDAFLRSNMQDFFTKAHPNFPAINLTSIDKQMLGRRRQALVEIIKDQCDMKWSPFLFDVFVFPLSLGQGEKYVMIELAYLDKQGRRRSCPLDCVPIPPQSYGMEVLKEMILETIRDFGVESKISGFNTWGTELQKLQMLLKKAAFGKGRQRALAFKENEEEVNKEYFSTLKKKQEDSVISIQLEIVQILYCLDQIENHLKTYIPGSPSENAQAVCFSDRLEIISRQFRVLGTKLTQLEDLGAKIKRKILHISRDKKYAVYYSQKNNPVNLLQIVPIHSYQMLLKDISCYIRNFCGFLENPEMEMIKPNFDMTDISEELLLIDAENTSSVPSMDIKKLIPMMLAASEHWKEILYAGMKNAEEYLQLCKYFTSYKTQSNVQSRYVEEFGGMALSTPPDMSPEEWKKAAFIRAWKNFETDSYN